MFNDSNFITRSDAKEMVVRTLVVTGVSEASDVSNEDIEAVYVAVNVWLGLLPETASFPRILLTHLLLEKGLITVVTDLNDYREAIIRSLERKEGVETLSAPSVQLLREAEPCKPYLADFIRSVSNWLPVWELIRFLGFVKRLRLLCAPVTDCLVEFLQGDDRCKALVYRDTSLPIPPTRSKRGFTSFALSLDAVMGQSVLDNALSCLTDLNKNSFLVQCFASQFTYIFRNYERDDTLFRLPPGATFEFKRNNSYLDKFKYILDYKDWFQEKEYPLARFIPPRKVFDRQPGNENRILFVPKDIKRKRLIAPEPIVRQVLGYAVDAGMRRCLLAYGVDLNDQTINQRLCAEASVTGMHVTVDIHAASDSTSVWTIPVLCQNTSLYEDLYACRTSFCVLPDNTVLKGKYRSNRWSTMGNVCTFSLETGIFYAALRTAVLVDMLFDKRFAKLSESKRNAKITEILNERKYAFYGDDGVIPSEYYETYRDILQAFGYIVNEEKTFSTGHYRESCGVEYWRGFEITHARFPRGAGGYDYGSLVSLQHKLWNVTGADLFLKCYIKRLKPSVTYSEVGSTHDDLWVEGYVRTPRRNSEYWDDSRYNAAVGAWERHLEKECPYCMRDKVPLHWHLSLTPNTLIRSENRFDRILLSGISIRSKYEWRSFAERSDGWKKFFSIPIRVTENWIFPKPTRSRYTGDTTRMENEAMVDLCRHTTVVTKNVGDLKELRETDKSLLELLAYLYAIGKGAETTNSSPYTLKERTIVSRSSFVYDNATIVDKREFFD